MTRGTQCSPGGAARARGAGEDTMKMLSGHLCQTPSEEGAQELQCHGSAPVGTRSGATSTGWGRAGTPRRQRALRALGLRRHRRAHSTTQSHTAGGFGCRMPAPAISGCYFNDAAASKRPTASTSRASQSRSQQQASGFGAAWHRQRAGGPAPTTAQAAAAEMQQAERGQIMGRKGREPPRSHILGIPGVRLSNTVGPVTSPAGTENAAARAAGTPFPKEQRFQEQSRRRGAFLQSPWRP